MNATEASITKGLRALPEVEQRIMIEEACEYRTFASRQRAKHILDRHDDSPQTIFDEALIV